jgi:hypothetical protein
MKIAGYNSITVSQQETHLSPEALERAFEKLECLNTSNGRRLEATSNPYCTENRGDSLTGTRMSCVSGLLQSIAGIIPAMFS